MDITIDELIAALEAATLRPETAHGITTKDLQAATGWSNKRITSLLHVLSAAGRLGVRRIYRVNLAGNLAPVPAYFLLPAETAGTENPPGESGGFG